MKKKTDKKVKLLMTGGLAPPTKEFDLYTFVAGAALAARHSALPAAAVAS